VRINNYRKVRGLVHSCRCWDGISLKTSQRFSVSCRSFRATPYRLPATSFPEISSYGLYVPVPWLGHCFLHSLELWPSEVCDWRCVSILAAKYFQSSLPLLRTLSHRHEAQAHSLEPVISPSSETLYHRRVACEQTCMRSQEPTQKAMSRKYDLDSVIDENQSVCRRVASTWMCTWE